MTLVCIAIFIGNIAEPDKLPVDELLKGGLELADPAEGFWRNAHMKFKQALEAAFGYVQILLNLFQ